MFTTNKCDISSKEWSFLQACEYDFIKNLETKNVYATISIETLSVIADCLNVPIVKLFED